ncbi:MAG: SoxR reducing system RseC family protein [Bacteroidota bacterium]
MFNETLTETGKVINVIDSIAEIVIEPSDKCEECSAKLFCNPKSELENRLSVKINNNIKIGDLVEISISGRNLLVSSLFLYGIPLVLLILFILVGLEIFSGNSTAELYSFLVSVGVIAVYYTLFHLIQKKYSDVLSLPSVKRIED